MAETFGPLYSRRAFLGPASSFPSAEQRLVADKHRWGQPHTLTDLTSTRADVEAENAQRIKNWKKWGPWALAALFAIPVLAIGAAAGGAASTALLARNVALVGRVARSSQILSRAAARAGARAGARTTPLTRADLVAIRARGAAQFGARFPRDFGALHTQFAPRTFLPGQLTGGWMRPALQIGTRGAPATSRLVRPWLRL